MTYISKTDYSSLDRPEICMFLFHPRSEWGTPFSSESYQEVLIPVENKKAEIGGRFHMTDISAPNILFFTATERLSAIMMIRGKCTTVSESILWRWITGDTENQQEPRL